MSRKVSSLDLLLLLAYFLGAGIVLYWIGRQATFRFSSYLHFVLQFFFGGMFSALVVFYFISASRFVSHLVVLFLLFLLVLNEFLKDRYHRLTLSWLLYAFCGIMYFNFALPHLFRSLHPGWFYLSLVLGLVPVFYLRKLSTNQGGRSWPTLVLAGSIVALYQINWIPPVPLVKKKMVVCRDLEKASFGSEVRYLGKIERPAPWDLWKKSDRTLRTLPQESLYFFNSIFLPRGIETRIYHKWYRFHQEDQKWILQHSSPIQLVGGRRGGFQTFSKNPTFGPGDWKVAAETEKGQVIGSLRLRGIERSEDEPLSLKNIVLY